MRSAIALLLLLTACGGAPAPVAGDATPGEAAALNDAAAMLDNHSLLPPANQTETPQ